MSDKDFKVIFSTNLKRFLQEKEMTQGQLAELLGVGTTSVYNWANGIKIPRMDKVDAMCKIFRCNRSDLIEECTLHEEKPLAQVEMDEHLIHLFELYNNLSLENQTLVENLLKSLQQ